MATTIDYSKWDRLVAEDEDDDNNATATIMSERDIVARDAATIPQCRADAKKVGGLVRVSVGRSASPELGYHVGRH